MGKDYINNQRNLLMGMLASDGVSVDDYAKFLSEFEIKEFNRQLHGEEEEEDPDYDYVPIADADEKTLKLKIQMRGVSKPPMWREVLVPADFNFSQLHYVIQAAMGLCNCHLWQFERTPYDRGGLSIGIPRSDNPFSFGIEDCTFHADTTPLTAFLANKGDKLVYVYDFRLDWIFNVTVADVLPRQGEVAECRKYKSEIQALDNYPPFLYELLRSYYEHPNQASNKEIDELLQFFRFTNKQMLDGFIEDNSIDLEFVNEELAEIPDEWLPID